MNNKQNLNKCYVFSQATLDIALEEWFKLEAENNPTQEESLLIALAALPWFFQHINQTGPTYVFTNDLLVSEIEEWKIIQITEYPNQESRIVSACEQLLNFFNSDIVNQHKMLIKTE